MKNGSAFPLVLIAFLTLCALYAPQPLLPDYAQAFAISETRAALLIAVALLPLSVAPLSFGALLQRFASARVLQAATFALAVLVGAQAAVHSFAGLVGLRLLQGVAVAAILTSLMTHIAAFARGGEVPRIMAWYVAATILGGFLGRLLAGFSAEYVSAGFYFVGLGSALAGGGVTLSRLERRRPSRVQQERGGRQAFTDVLRTGRYVRIYALVFCLFFTFSALMNFLPFRLQELPEGASGVLTGLLYGGYLVGMAVSLKAPQLARRLGGEARAAVAGAALGFVALIVAALPVIWALFAAVVLICGSMFLVHSLAAGWVNRAAGGRGGVINGLYVALYYAGGVLGAYAPGFVYERWGWNAFLVVLALMVGGGQVAALRWWRRERASAADT